MAFIKTGFLTKKLKISYSFLFVFVFVFVFKYISLIFIYFSYDFVQISPECEITIFEEHAERL